MCKVAISSPTTNKTTGAVEEVLGEEKNLAMEKNEIARCVMLTPILARPFIEENHHDP